ncbi:diaminopimelate epimerase [Buchnera aphidicola]|nr:diaminopimelate epimerase [Buchnera aphidicola]
MFNTNKKKIFFTKMHGLKNDFVIINNYNKKYCFSKNLIKKISNRYTGIGCDQVLILEPPLNTFSSDFHYRIFNSNGIEVFQCGNGVRCLSQFIKKEKLISKKKITVSTNTTIMKVENIDDKVVKVWMQEPDFHPNASHFNIQLISEKYSILVNQNLIVDFGVVFLGNPHCVIIVQDINNINVNYIGKFLNNKSFFLEGVNVEFMEIINKNMIKVRVYERGVGETQACGSGACAAASIGILNNLLNEKVVVKLNGGKITIFWNRKKKIFNMIGETEYVYEGYFYI